MFARRLKRVIQFVGRPVRPLLCNLVMPINSGVARGLKGHVGQWTIPMPAEPEEEFLRRLRLSECVIYDVGANIGATTLFFARAAGVKGRVISFEPNPEVLPLLKSHVAINRFRNVEIHGVAVGAVNGRMPLVIPKGRRGSGRLGGCVETTMPSRTTRATSGEHPFEADCCNWNDANSVSYRVDVVHLDGYRDAQRLATPDLVKIDTEGHELACLRGMTDILKSSQPALYLEMHGATQLEKSRNCRHIVCYLHELGYDLYHVESSAVVTPDRWQNALGGHLFAHSNDGRGRCCPPAPLLATI